MRTGKLREGDIRAIEEERKGFTEGKREKRKLEERREEEIKE